MAGTLTAAASDLTVLGVNLPQVMYLLYCIASGAEQDYKGFAIYGIIYSPWTEKGSETGLVTAIMERCGKAHPEKKPPWLCLVQRGQLKESWLLLFTVFWSTSV